jgi:hypothetical protein
MVRPLEPTTRLLRDYSTMSFPSDWPPGCPPKDAVPANGEVFRIVRNDPVTSQDFLSQFDLNAALTADECYRRSLSVFRKYSDAVHMMRMRPKLGRFVASRALSCDQGKTLHTGGKSSTHTEWWAFEDVDRRAGFVVLPDR